MTRKQLKMLLRIAAAAILIIVLAVIPVKGLPRLLLYLIPYLIVGYDILYKAVRGIGHGQIFDEHFLMAVATLGAFALGMHSGSGNYTEAVAVMLFYQIGEWFQSYALGKSRRSISDLMDIRPDEATLEIDGVLETVDPDDVAVGSTIVVRPGEKVPLDGVVIEGHSALDTAALTGESLPKDIQEGDDIVSGCINLSGVLKVRTTKPFEDATVSKILELVENAGMHKARSEHFISRFARYYTPIVVIAAAALAVLPPLLRMGLMGLAPAWSDWIYRALTFLVISCPCALVISIPLSFFAGIGGASRAGVLVKGSDYLEVLSRTRTVVFDKTGTLTQGIFEVNGIHHSHLHDDRLLELAAHAGGASSHPISRSLNKAYGKPADMTRVENIEEIGGAGILATVDGIRVATGNETLMDHVGAKAIPCSSVGAVVHIALDGEYAGHILINDAVKPHSAEAVEALHREGVRRAIMLTGDEQRVADEVKAALGLDEAYGELLPADKVAKVEALLETEGDDRLAFVGDGINDAPVLRRADVGIAMGALGSDAAIEAADIVLMDDDPLSIPLAMRIARRTLRIVHQNIIFAIGVKLLVLLLGALGVASMWLAIFADVGVMVLAVLNAIRALRVPSSSQRA